MGLVYHLDEVVTFSRTQHPAQIGSNQYVSFLKSLAPTRSARRKRRIFIHRDRGRRGIANEEELYETLSVHEIEVLRLETLGLRQQIEIFSEAEFVMGVHGAGLSNLVFCDTGTAVVEIIPFNYSTATYTVLSSQIGHRHMCYIEPSETNHLLATKSQFSDTMIEIPRWTEFLNRCVERLL